jgi:energy-coupling factor transporter ATP-binding protein EcfA2
MVCVMGPSGCGKSTLLKALGGQLKPRGGRIDLNGGTLEIRSDTTDFTARNIRKRGNGGGIFADHAVGIGAQFGAGPPDLPDVVHVLEFEFDDLPRRQAGGAQGHQATRTTSKTGEPEQDMFSVTVSVRVVTERAIVAASPVSGFSTLHDYRVARAKVLMLRGALNGTIAGVTALSLPYHRLAVQGFAGQTPTIEDDAFDVTELGWNLTYQLLADAWPDNVAP